ncbi:Clavaminate synthase-like protein [Clavulina sp. PMI_390]|nr:Clavaminate synthase-like protein [Clavulina sp. PMI_390]
MLIVQQSALPIISIEPWLPSAKPSPQAKQQVARELHEACLRYGFFYLDITSFASQEETDEIEALARKFFGLEQHVKDQISIAKSDRARGYQRLNENVTLGKADSHEGLDLYRPVEKPDRTKPLQGENQWPSDVDVPGFREKYERWVERMKELGLIVMEAMATGLGMTPDEWSGLRAQVDDSFWVMRVIGYPQLPQGHDGISCGSHKDYGCLTFLYADPTPNALQVFLPGKDGQAGRWINADPIPGCIVVNIGEMWEIWTSGLYKSTLHRVVHRGENYRVSIPFFFEPNFDAMIAPIPAAERILASLKPAPTPPASSTSGASLPPPTEFTSSGAGSIFVTPEGIPVKKPRKTYAPVKYGEFLTKKVGGNFSDGAGRYA